LGFDEIFDGPGFKFVEWPGQGAGWLPPANVEVSLSLHAPSQTSEEPVDLVAQMQRKVSVRFA
jgi:tRNA A37 threonylcarbamoyladenosine biosynthesis protein TsaE